jgi:hypothetical protein
MMIIWLWMCMYVCTYVCVCVWSWRCDSVCDDDYNYAFFDIAA